MLLVIPSHIVEHRDLAISSGALLQFRVFGGGLGLALASAVMHSYLPLQLSHSVSSEYLAVVVLQSTEAIKGFPIAIQRSVLEKFAEGYDLQMKVFGGVCGVAGVLCRVIVEWGGEMGADSCCGT